MQATELVAKLQAARADLEAALAGLEPEQLLTPGVLGAWTVKDVLAHLTAWEVELVTGLAKFKRGVSPGKTQYTPAEIEAQNTRWHAEAQSRPLDRVLADLRGVRRQTLRQLETLTERDLNAPRAWLRDSTIAEWVLTWVVEHETEHAQHLAHWRAQTGTPPPA